MDAAFIALVCGGRDYADRDAVFRALDTLHARHPNLTILQGGANGADALAHAWAMARQRPSITVPAEWGKCGKAAGPIRNAIMLAYLPHGVVARFRAAAGRRTCAGRPSKRASKFGSQRRGYQREKCYPR